MSPSAFFTSEVDPHFKLDRSRPIYIPIEESAEPKTKQLHERFVTELQRFGYRIVPEISKDSLLMLFALNGDVKTVQSYWITPTFSSTSGTIGGLSYSGTTQGSAVVPISYDVHIQRIYVRLFEYDSRRQQINFVWNGYVGVGRETFKNNAQEVVRRLLEMIGRNYDGHVALTGSFEGDRTEVFETGNMSEIDRRLEGRHDQEKQCRSGQLDLCIKLADLYLAGPETGRDPQHGIQLLEYACERNSGKACMVLGASYFVGNPVLKDLTKAAHYFELGCNEGNLAACAQLGLLYSYGEGVSEDRPRAMTLLRRACDGGETNGCGWLALLVKDDIEATSLFKRGCEGGDPLSCGAMASRYESGCCGVQKDEVLSLRLNEKGCDGGHSVSCATIASKALRGVGMTQNISNGMRLHERACGLGYVDSCEDLGVLWFEGKLVQKDQDKATKYLQIACQKGRETACKTLKHGVSPNQQTSAKEYEWKCLEGNASSCIAYGALSFRGQLAMGIDQDRKRSLQLFERACRTLHSARGCAWLGRIKLEGVGILKDEHAGIQLLEESCQQHDFFGCGSLAEAFEQGKGVAADSVRAQELYRRACEYGDKGSCSKVSSRTERALKPDVTNCGDRLEHCSSSVKE